MPGKSFQRAGFYARHLIFSLEKNQKNHILCGDFMTFTRYRFYYHQHE